MDVGHMSVTNVKLWSWKSRHRRPPQIPEHQSFIICLTGFYSCRWGWQKHRTVKPGHWCCKKRECSFFAILMLALSFWFIFLSLWGGAKNDYHNFDVYSYTNTGYWFHWSIFLLVLAVFAFSYVLFLLILAVCLLCENQQLYLHCCHKTMTTFVLFLCIIGLIGISLFWKRQWYTFYLSFQISAPFLHMAAILTMILLAWPVAIHFFQMKNRVLQILILTPYLVVLIFLIFVPLGMNSPCIQEKGALGPKPGLIGHRGAPMLAPENTEMSFVKTIDYGADGLETDVTISFDGVPFLMHDQTLKRTTNIGTLFPKIRNKKASFFSWPTLQLLNAGQWFFKTPKEYRTMWIVTDSLALLFIFLIFGFHWWREVNYFCNADSEMSVTTSPSHRLAVDLNKMPSVA